MGEGVALRVLEGGSLSKGFKKREGLNGAETDERNCKHSVAVFFHI